MRHAYLMVAGLFLWLTAAVWSVSLLPLLQRLPPDYESVIAYDARARSRPSPTAQWKQVKLAGRRTDRTMVNRDGYAFIQANVYWARPDGTLEFENAGLYGVDRYSRRNLAGLGNLSRSGQFLFPFDVRRGQYELWDPSFGGPRRVRYVRSEDRGGIPAYVFDFTLRGLDETAGYVHLPDVPERYRVLTDGIGTLWVEPVSGRVIDYVEQGRSYLVSEQGGPVGDVLVREAKLGEGSRRTQREHAVSERRRARWLGWGVPALLIVGGALVMLVAFHRRRAGEEA